MKILFLISLIMITMLNAKTNKDILVQVASLIKNESVPIVKNNLLKIGLIKTNIKEKKVRKYKVIYYKDINKLNQIKTLYKDAFLIHKKDIKKNILLKSKRTIKIKYEKTNCEKLSLLIHKKKI